MNTPESGLPSSGRLQHRHNPASYFSLRSNRRVKEGDWPHRWDLANTASNKLLSRLFEKI